MKKLFMVLGFLVAFQTTALCQYKLELDGRQSMCISGKGPGQDGAINPYLGEKSIATVKNVGKNTLEVRIQEGNEIIEIVALSPKEKQDFNLDKNYVLYFDAKQKAAGEVSFRRPDKKADRR